MTQSTTWVATVRGTYGTAEAGTRTQYVQYVAPWEQAALRVRYVQNAGGWYASPVRTQRRHRGARVSSVEHPLGHERRVRLGQLDRQHDRRVDGTCDKIYESSL